jgi:hypothetical protein
MLESASLEDDEELQKAWAALMANAACPGSRVQPGFAHTLKQMTKDDVLFLESLFDSREDLAAEHILGRQRRPDEPWEFDDRSLLEVMQRAGLTKYASADYITLPLIRENLTRLGILEKVIRPNLVIRPVDRIHGPAKDEITDVENLELYALTTFGTAFIEVCRPPKTSARRQ